VALVRAPRRWPLEAAGNARETGEDWVMMSRATASLETPVRGGLGALPARPNNEILWHASWRVACQQSEFPFRQGRAESQPWQASPWRPSRGDTRGTCRMADTKAGVSTSGLTEAEAKEFHAVFVTSLITFFIVVIIAHVLAYNWRPFWPGPNGWVAAMGDHLTTVTSLLT